MNDATTTTVTITIADGIKYSTGSNVGNKRHLRVWGERERDKQGIRKARSRFK